MRSLVLVLALLLGAAAWAGPGAEAARWIGSLSGLSSTGAGLLWLA